MKNVVIRKACSAEVEIIQELNNELINYEMQEGFDCYVKDWALSEESKKYFLEMIENREMTVVIFEGSSKKKSSVNKICSFSLSSCNTSISFSVRIIK